MKRSAAALAGPTLAASARPATLAVGGSRAGHTTAAAKSASASSSAASVATASKASCAALASWNQRGQAAVKALYADTGALTADAKATTAKAVVSAGRKLTSDAIAAATLPVPPVGAASWKTLTAAYAAAGTALGSGAATGAVPQLQAGNTAISEF